MASSVYANRKYLLVFLLAWLAWTAIHSFVLYTYGWPFKTAIKDALTCNVILMLGALLINIPLRYYLPSSNRYSYLIGLLGIVWLLCFALSRGLLVFFAAGNNYDYNNFFSTTVPVRLAVSLLLLCSNMLVMVLYYTLQQHRSEASRKQELEDLAREAELFHLKEQLHPHFLFNSLNSINALVGREPSQARSMINQLAEFLRGTVRKDHLQWHTLEEEIAHLQRYLNIEAVRFGDRLNVAWNINNVDLNARLPALLLQPVLENAIKYGLYDVIGEVKIEIEARTTADDLLIEITNPFDAETHSAAAGTGFGLRSIQRRLYLIFGQADLLNTQAANSIFITRIRIPQRAI